MKLMFIGATHEVTGSCTYLEACGKKILIDCGMEQGVNHFENVPLPVSAADIDMVFSDSCAYRPFRASAAFI